MSTAPSQLVLFWLSYCLVGSIPALADDAVKPGGSARTEANEANQVLVKAANISKVKGEYVHDGWVLFAHADYLGAIQKYREALAVPPDKYNDDKPIHALIGEAYRRLGRTLESDQEYELAGGRNNNRVSKGDGRRPKLLDDGPSSPPQAGDFDRPVSQNSDQG